jgi:hypothetical protein
LVVYVADAGKQMVLDLKIQSSHIPSQQPVGASKVDRGGNLVCGPGRSLSVIHRRVKALRRTVSQLKHGTECESQHAAARHVEEKNPFSGLKQQRQEQRPRDEHALADEESDDCASGPRDVLGPDASAQERREIVVPVPLEGQEGIREPQIHMLISVQGSPFLQRAQTTKAAQVNILVHP